MERRERATLQRALAGLLRLLRQWEALHALSRDELGRALDAQSRADYLRPAQAGQLLATASLDREALSTARAALLRRWCASRSALAELARDGDGIAEALEALCADAGCDAASVAAPVAPAASRDAAAIRGMLSTAAGAVRQEAALRKSLLQALGELEPGQEKERQRLAIAWSECPFALLDEGAPLSRLRSRAQEALDTLGP
eukprot:TRINITY_DN29542_c0_g1_i1.p2 TRINITY_DN29542_c0_g1~~TRINITY_DN29542_c0_g1_i1.p2  ORF type:complete len:201 (+),score=58.40 TRINITY_DN29542_c0_g1_i1:94-696(+)